MIPSSQFLFFLALVVGPFAMNANEKIKRPENWASPVVQTGVPNLHKVDARLYRSAQPSRKGMEALQKMGVKTIVNLRSFHSDRDEIGTLPLQYEHIYMKAWHPEEKELVRFLRIVGNPENTPVLVHCMHGADRTGLLCAVYRIVVQGWSKKEALQEMRQGGFGYHEVWINLPTYLEELDVPRLKKQMEKAPPAKK